MVKIGSYPVEFTDVPIENYIDPYSYKKILKKILTTKDVAKVIVFNNKKLIKEMILKSPSECRKKCKYLKTDTE